MKKLIFGQAKRLAQIYTAGKRQIQFLNVSLNLYLRNTKTHTQIHFSVSIYIYMLYVYISMFMCLYNPNLQQTYTNTC